MEPQKSPKKAWIISIIALIIVAVAVFFVLRGGSDETTNTENPTSNSQVTDGATNDQMTQIKLFYYALDDNGAHGKLIGCGDSVVPVTKDIPATRAPLTAALNMLLSDKRTDVEDGLKNILYKSDLALESAQVSNGKATVRITGTVRMGGVCDEPRFMAQIEETILQFPTVSTAEIFINGEPMKSYLSQKG